jgi:hypothetical protein
MENKYLEVGMKVYYTAPHGKTENGIVKSINGCNAFVVYNCGGDWDHYEDYTGCATNPSDLTPGWILSALTPQTNGQ